MNIGEWQRACQEGWAPRKYDNLSRSIQKSLKYNPDPNATVRHHLLDTPEQIEYNTNHYEMWGHNLDGTFEYGKYMIFVTKEEHLRIHKDCDDTRQKKSICSKLTWQDPEIRRRRIEGLIGHETSDEAREKISEANKGHIVSDETREKISYSLKGKYIGENSKNFGKKRSDETKLKLRNSHLGKKLSDTHKLNISQSVKENPPWLGKHLSEDTKKKISENNGKSMLGKHHTEETKQKCRESKLGEKNPMYGMCGELCPNFGRKGELNPLFGKKMTESFCDHLKDIRSFTSLLYNDYKSNGGSLSWNEFNHALKSDSSADSLIHSYVLRLISYKDEPNRPREEKQMKTNYLVTTREEFE